MNEMRKLMEMVDPQDEAPRDVRGIEIQDGDLIAKADKYYQMDGLHIKVATASVRNGKVYLDGSNRPLKFPDRVAVLGR
jgi:hypothetical protein